MNDVKIKYDSFLDQAKSLSKKVEKVEEEVPAVEIGEVKKGLPVPKQQKSTLTGQVVKDKLLSMEIGDSVLLTPTYGNTRQSLRSLCHNIALQSRKEGDGFFVDIRREGDSIRVWKTLR